jgi:hypothetical protein
MFGKSSKVEQTITSAVQAEVTARCARNMNCEVAGMSTDREEMSKACGHLAAAGFYSEEVNRCPFVQLGEILDATDKLYAEMK